MLNYQRVKVIKIDYRTKEKRPLLYMVQTSSIVKYRQVLKDWCQFIHFFPKKFCRSQWILHYPIEMKTWNYQPKIWKHKIQFWPNYHILIILVVSNFIPLKQQSTGSSSHDSDWNVNHMLKPSKSTTTMNVNHFGLSGNLKGEDYAIALYSTPWTCPCRHLSRLDPWFPSKVKIGTWCCAKFGRSWQPRWPHLKDVEWFT